MKLKMKKLIAAALCAAVAFTFTAYAPEEVYAATGSGTNTTRGVYWFCGDEVPADLTDTYVYSDDLLKGDSLKYNKKLATMSYELTIASISSRREKKTEAGYRNKSRNLRAYLEDNGFIDYETNRDYKVKMNADSMGVACAHKKIVDGGKKYTLIAIVPRSAGYEAEWVGNFLIGQAGDHASFKNGMNKALDHAKKYIKKHGIKGNIKVWTAGYSRGAGVINQMGAALLRDPKAALGNSITLKPGNLYCYTFGTPRSADATGDYKDSRFRYIHNTYEGYDAVTVLPPSQLGFERYGPTVRYAIASNRSRMLSFLKKVNSKVYNDYIRTADPDKFKPKKLDINAFAKSRKLKFINDNNSYLPKTQGEYLELIADALATAVGNSRQSYYDSYEEALGHLFGYFFANYETGANLLDGLMSSKFAVPMVISMYISFMSERYQSRNISTAVKVLIRGALNDMIIKSVNEAKEEGREVPAGILQKCEALKTALDSKEKFGDLADDAWDLTALLYAETLRDGLIVMKADSDTIAQLTDPGESRAVSRLLAYMMLYDKNQKEDMSFSYVNQQFKHFATFAGNASSLIVPHYCEIIVSWLKAKDPNYNGMKKENAAQKAGYRRIFVKAAGGASVTGTVKNSRGRIVAKFRNGRILSRSNKWIGITTCDKGSWLRLPINYKYKVKMKVSRSAKMSLKVAEYSVAKGKVVRTVTKDSKRKWSKISVKKKKNVTLVIPAVKKGKSGYRLPSKLRYSVTVR